MKNKIIAIILLLVFAVSFAGCNMPWATPVPSPTAEPTPTVEPTPTPEPTPEPTSPLPIINKNPTSETVYEGGSCKFVTWYENATIAIWHFVNPKGDIDLTYIQAARQFPTLVIIHGMYSIMTLDNIPLGLDGWKVYCEYQNENGSMNTGMALITVLPVVIPAPTPVPSPTPASTPSPTPTPFVPSPEVSNEDIFKDSAQEFVNWLTAVTGNELVFCEVITNSFTLRIRYNVSAATLTDIQSKVGDNLAANIRETLNLDTINIQNIEHLIVEIYYENELYYEVDLITNETLYIKTIGE